MDSNERSPYHPLEQSERQFRLLRFLGSDPNRPRCEIKSFSLLNDDLPPWKALSYRWGDDEPKFMIYLNDHLVSIRKGLRTFIRQMIAEKRRGWYFIDALCIDQANNFEKQYQVQQMGEIYRRAEEVVAWIVYEPYHYERDESHVLHAVYDHDGHTHDVSSLSRARVERAVLENSYWSRLWILQEILLAKMLTIRIGSAEVDWFNLIPKKTRAVFEHRGLPANNDTGIINFRQSGTEPYANRKTALNILSYRRFESESLRAGKHLRFHEAVDFFAMQRCGRPHDVVYGYLGLTNSRIQVDYSIPILDLFVATLADYLLSAGLITEHLTRWQYLRNRASTARANDLIAPLLAFGFNPCEPVVHLLVREVTKFFAPGFEVGLTSVATGAWFTFNRLEVSTQDIRAFLIDSEHKSGLKYIGSLGVKFVKLAASEMSACAAMAEELKVRLKTLEEEDAVMSAPGESNESRKYSQWVAHAREISEQVWQRFLESGEDSEGGLDDDESWALIA